jgi:hypothetical protein
MKVLIACEYSGRVRDAFIAAGHEAISCDLLPTEVDGPHYQGGVFDIINDGFDLMIAHPPCTYLSVSGLHWNARGALVDGRPRQELTEQALCFVRRLMDADIPRIAIENPVSCISSRIRKPDQVIQPYNFGEDASKKTCLWLKGLRPLESTAFYPPRMVCCGHVIEDELGKYWCPVCNGKNIARNRWGNQTDSGQNKIAPSVDRWKERSRTFQGIAKAMADQWGLK